MLLKEVYVVRHHIPTRPSARKSGGKRDPVVNLRLNRAIGSEIRPGALTFNLTAFQQYNLLLTYGLGVDKDGSFFKIRIEL